MKKNKKGFTLVELLAVIVILAVIAVIAVPQVLKIIETSRKDAFKASVRSAFKAAELAVTKGETSGSLKELAMENNTFTDGGWGIVDGKLVIFSAMNNTYSTGKVDQTVKGTNFDVYKVTEVNAPKTLASRMTTTLLGSNGNIKESGYITGANPNNYVYLKIENIDNKFRLVKVNSDGSILMVTDDVLKNGATPIYKSYYYRAGSCDWDYFDGCKSNFAESDIINYLNTIFYDRITNKNLIKSNYWDTSLSDNGINYSGAPSSTQAKVGLLTLKDYLTVAEVSVSTNSNNYLKLTNYYWWLGTGHNSNAQVAWGVNQNGASVIDYGPVSNDIDGGVRPAIVLNPGVILNCSVGSGTGECDGTVNRPYRIEN